MMKRARRDYILRLEFTSFYYPDICSIVLIGWVLAAIYIYGAK